jgi:glucose-6-phosphate 1-dehydrogenase
MVSIHKTPFVLVIFGGTGDLSERKLFPSLFNMFLDGVICPDSKILVASRADFIRTDLDAWIDLALSKVTRPIKSGESGLSAFRQLVSHIKLDATRSEDFISLGKQIGDTVAPIIFYLATRSDLYTHICKNLAQTSLNGPSSRVVLEKPIGMDLVSAQALADNVDACFTEKQIYRIDHYLGKETVQNLLVLRFANSIFETQWNQKYIDHIQITISETIGVEGRAEFYESVGALRDMVQNHLLQLLCITAMEPPAKLHPDAVRDEKVKVLRALRPITGGDIQSRVVRGQYRDGVSHAELVKGYLKEDGVKEDSATETFVAMKVEIDNWRWAGVPFYLRTGKRLTHRACEIAVHFKEVPHSIFEIENKNTMANKLIFRLQPDEGVKLSVCEKRAGPGMSVNSTNLSLNPDRARKARVPDAYERLLGDVIGGNQTLFVREDELMAAWEWLDPVISQWQSTEQRPEPYTAGTWGPAAATLLLARDGRLWDEVGL